MDEKKPRIGKKGGAQRVAEEFAKLRRTPLPKEVFSIVDEHHKKNRQSPQKKTAKTKIDLDA
jgi:hypothetical protein